MIRFGLHMTLRSGREALVRLLVTMAAVGIGVGLLLSVLATYHAYQVTVDRPCWECTHQAAPNQSATLLWNYGEDIFAGKTIERLDVAALSPAAPVVPGLTTTPAPGQYYASPALAALLASVPAGELSDRFPGRLAGTIAPAGLSGPDQLSIVIGYDPTELAELPPTLRISQIQSTPRDLSTSTFYRFGFALGAVALLVPMMVLIGTATRMAAARREERYAALRLVGATRNQINVIASLDAVVGALLGALLGIGLYALLHPALADLPLLGARFFTDEITPTGAGYAAAVIVVPVAAAAACLMSLRRVGISPLGVSRRVTPPTPRAWRAIPLAIGLLSFCVPLLLDASAIRHSPGPAVISLVLVMLGLMVAGPWLTMQAARILARYARGGSALLAARRLADNPRAAFRTVSGLVLAVLVGTALAALVPAAIAAQHTTQDTTLDNVLRVGFLTGDPTGAQACVGKCGRGALAPSLHGLPPTTATTLLAQLTAIPGTRLLPLYLAPSGGPSESVISCADLRILPVLGTCAPGADTVVADTGAMFTDNIAALNTNLPFVNTASPRVAGNSADRDLAALLVTVDSSATLERARTVLSGDAASINPTQTPLTFGEVGQVRATLYLEVQRMVTIIAGITLLIAGCALAVAVSGSLVERRRPFTLLRVGGTSTRALYRAVILETVFPLLAATVVAAAVGLALALPIARALAPTRHALAIPGSTYYLTLGGGLLVAILVILACLPVLGRITRTESARFE